MKADLRGMNRKQVQEVLDYAALLLKNAAEDQGPSRDVEMWADSLLRSLKKVLANTPDGIPTKHPLRHRLLESHKQVTGFISSSGIALASTAERKALYNLLGDLLVRGARNTASKVDAPLSLRFILGQAPAIPSLFDRAFPGYLEGGMARLVLSGLLSGRTSLG